MEFTWLNHDQIEVRVIAKDIETLEDKERINTYSINGLYQDIIKCTEKLAELERVTAELLKVPDRPEVQPYPKAPYAK